MIHVTTRTPADLVSALLAPYAPHLPKDCDLSTPEQERMLLAGLLTILSDEIDVSVEALESEYGEGACTDTLQRWGRVAGEVADVLRCDRHRATTAAAPKSAAHSDR